MTSFSDLGLSPEVVQAVTEAGYETPTPIQAQSIPVAMTGRDVLGIAQTGTGKTAAFTLPMIDRLAQGRARARMPRSLVLCPTRELADQVASAFDKYAKNHKLSWALLIGGVSFDDQEKKLDRGVDVLIATPGRLLDHFERGKLLMTGVQIMVVDEADRMLDMGFIPDIERIFKLTPPSRQTLFFSATMPPEITRLTTQFLKDPTRIEVARPATVVDTITQYVAKVPVNDPKAKRTALRVLIERSEVNNGIVFCNRKSEVDIVAKSLKKHGFDASAIHGDLDQATRMRTLEAFRSGDLKLLVASDVAARGLDIPAVSHVFNYDVPHHAEDYVHRIGRTGRAGRTGEAFMIVTPDDGRQLDKVLKLIKQSPEEVTLDIDWSEIPTGERRSRSGGRDGRNGRDSRRGEHRDRPRKDHGERAAMESIAQPEADENAEVAEKPRRSRRSRSETEAPAAEARAPKPAEERSERPRRSRAETEAPRADAAPARAPKPAEDRGDRARGGVKEPPARTGQERDGAVVGFGADVPAFLLRATPFSKDALAD